MGRGLRTTAEEIPEAALTDLRYTIRRHDGSVTTPDLLVAAEPAFWSAGDAKEALWVIVRLLEVPAVFRVGLVEVEPAKSWRIEVHTPTGVALTPALRLSSMAHVWLTEVAFECPENGGVH